MNNLKLRTCCESLLPNSGNEQSGTEIYLERNGTIETFSGELAKKIRNFQNRQMPVSLRHEIMVIHHEGGNAKPGELASYALRFSSILWNTFVLKKAHVDNCNGLLGLFDWREVAGAARTCRIIKGDLRREIGETAAVVFLSLLAAALIRCALDSDPFSLTDRHHLLSLVWSASFGLYAAACVLVGFFLRYRIRKLDCGAESSQAKSFRGYINNFTGCRKGEEDFCSRVSSLFSKLQFPMAIVAEEISTLDNFSRCTLSTIMNSGYSGAGAVLWVFFSCLEDGKPKVPEWLNALNKETVRMTEYRLH